MDIAALYELYLQHPQVQTDTRRIQEGDIFFALKGPNFNGNTFAKAALGAGAACAVIDEPAYEIRGKTFLVPDALTALQQLAKFHREQLHIPVLAITGSNGKTTTKELIHAVLSSAYRTYTTAGNLNNHIGVPLTLLKIKNDAQVAVVEMGANHLGEIASYCAIALPTHGLITNCGKAHLQGFGGIEGVKKGKGELFDYLRTRADGTAFIMHDYDYLQEMSHDIQQVITYGTHDAATTGVVVPEAEYLHVLISGHATMQINTRLVGSYNLPNVLAAVAVGRYFNIPDETIKQAIENYQPANSRSQLMEAGSNTIILDAYNANPTSMRLAIENMAGIKADKKVLVLGAMAEMGDAAAAEHEQLVRLIDNYKWEAVILVGSGFQPFAKGYMYFNNADEAAGYLSGKSYSDTYFLIKGSRSAAMEKILPALQKA